MKASTAAVAQPSPVASRTAAPTGPEAVSTPLATGDVIGNKNSKKYHLLGCPGYNQVGEKNRVMFKTAAEAEAAGYVKAGNCKK